MTWRCWFAHRWSRTLMFMVENAADRAPRLYVRCSECGWDSPGVVIPGTTPVIPMQTWKAQRRAS